MKKIKNDIKFDFTDLMPIGMEGYSYYNLVKTFDLYLLIETLLNKNID